jgi:hypothetical protein
MRARQGSKRDDGDFIWFDFILFEFKPWLDDANQTGTWESSLPAACRRFAERCARTDSLCGGLSKTRLPLQSTRFVCSERCESVSPMACREAAIWTVEIGYTAQIWKEGSQFIAHAMPLDVAGSGATPLVRSPCRARRSGHTVSGHGTGAPNAQ